MILRSSFFVIAAALVSAACSSSSPSSSGVTGQTSAAFSRYCTATLKVDHELMLPGKGGAWIGDGSAHAAAGTPFYLSTSFDHWGGFVIRADGSPAEIQTDFGTGLVDGTDFTSDCADASKLTTFGSFVLLSEAKLYASEALSGTACTLAAGTELTNYSYSAIGSAITLSAAEVTKQCGFEKAYASTLQYGALVVR